MSVRKFYSNQKILQKKTEKEKEKKDIKMGGEDKGSYWKYSSS